MKLSQRVAKLLTVLLLVNLENPNVKLLQVFSNSQPYYGIFYMVEIFQNNRLENLNSSATASKHCPDVSELLDEAINSYVSLKRVKHYHQICLSST